MTLSYLLKHSHQTRRKHLASQSSLTTTTSLSRCSGSRHLTMVAAPSSDMLWRGRTSSPLTGLRYKYCIEVINACNFLTSKTLHWFELYFVWMRTWSEHKNFILMGDIDKLYFADIIKHKIWLEKRTNLYIYIIIVTIIVWNCFK